MGVLQSDTQSSLPPLKIRERQALGGVFVGFSIVEATDKHADVDSPIATAPAASSRTLVRARSARKPLNVGAVHVAF